MASTFCGTDCALAWAKFIPGYVFGVDTIGQARYLTEMFHRMISDELPNPDAIDADLASACSENSLFWCLASVVDRVFFIDWLNSQFDGRQIRNALDIGCGLGEVLAFFLSRGVIQEEALGVDGSSRLIETAERLVAKSDLKLSFKEALASSLPCEDGKFDLVLSLDMLHWCREWREAISEIGRVLRPGGMTVILYQPQSLFHRCLGSADDIIELLAKVKVTAEVMKTSCLSGESGERILIVGEKRQ